MVIDTSILLGTLREQINATKLGKPLSPSLCLYGFSVGALEHVFDFIESFEHERNDNSQAETGN